MHITLEKVTLLLVVLLHQTLSLSLRNHSSTQTSVKHQYWFIKDQPAISGNDDRWSYCDYKCLTLQKSLPNKDFVVIFFTAPLKQDFSACYVKTGSTYTLWSKVTQNKFYQSQCGQDYKDWIIDGGFTVTGIYGVGIGSPLNQTQMYKNT